MIPIIIWLIPKTFVYTKRILFLYVFFSSDFSMQSVYEFLVGSMTYKLLRCVWWGAEKFLVWLTLQNPNKTIKYQIFFLLLGILSMLGCKLFSTHLCSSNMSWYPIQLNKKSFLILVTPLSWKHPGTHWIYKP